MRRGLLMLSVLTLGLTLIGSASAKPGDNGGPGNSGAGHACQDGGYLNYTDADGNGFKNTGQCVRYAAQGGKLIAPTPDLILSDGVLTGTGFPSDATVRLRLRSSLGAITGFHTTPTDSTGTFLFTNETVVTCFQNIGFRSTAINVTIFDLDRNELYAESFRGASAGCVEPA